MICVFRVLWMLSVIDCITSTSKATDFETSNGGCEQECFESATPRGHCRCNHGYTEVHSQLPCQECFQELNMVVVLHKYLPVHESSTDHQESFVLHVFDDLPINEHHIHVTLLNQKNMLAITTLTSYNAFKQALANETQADSFSNVLFSRRLAHLRKTFQTLSTKRKGVPNLTFIVIEHNYSFIQPVDSRETLTYSSPVLEDLDDVLREAKELEETDNIALVVVEIRNGPAKNGMLSFIRMTSDYSSWWSVHNSSGLTDIIMFVKESIQHYAHQICKDAEVVCPDTKSNGRQCVCFTSNGQYRMNVTCCEKKDDAYKEESIFSGHLPLLVTCIAVLLISCIIISKGFAYIKRYICLIKL